MANYRGSHRRLAVLFIVCYGTIALGGSSLHGLLGCSLHAPALGAADHEPQGLATSTSPSHTCSLCDYLAQGQITPQRLIVACANVVQAGEIDYPPTASIVSIPRSTRPRAPPH